MSRVLQLQSFRRPPAPDPMPTPVYDAADLAAARAEGEAAGRAAAEDAAAEALRAAVEGLAAALADDAARRTALAAGWTAELQGIAAAIAATLAGPVRGSALADRVVAALSDLAEDEAPPARIRCEAGSMAALQAALTAAGIEGIAVEVGDVPGASFALGEGMARIDPDRLEAALNDIIAEIGTGTE